MGCVRRANARLVLFDAGREIRCHSDVQRIVTASKDIDPHETTMPSSGGVDQSGFGDVAMSFDSRLRGSLRAPFAGESNGAEGGSLRLTVRPRSAGLGAALRYLDRQARSSGNGRSRI
jgi:hypothetical protein